MSGKKTRRQAAQSASSRAAQKIGTRARLRAEPVQVSGRWLLWAVSGTIAAAALCAWGVLCLLFWQGSWQLLYHPSASVARTPAGVSLAFEPVAFAVTEAGAPQIQGWWIPAAPDSPFGRYTVLLLHGKTGNMGDTLDALNRLHRVGVNVLVFDYRGFGQSRFVRPSEASLRQDADWALSYLTATRHIDSGTIVLDGEELGANLALEMAAAHPELAGVIAEFPIPSPADAIFNDARAGLVPAHLLVRDRYDLSAAAAGVRVPVLWIQDVMQNEESRAYAEVKGRKMMVELVPGKSTDQQIADALSRWFDELPPA
jgi:uncharacterized protein